MEFEDMSTERKRVLFAIAAAVLGWIMYAVKQDWTPNALIGAFAELFYRLYIYLLMPFAFSGLLFVMAAYVVNRVRGRCGRDLLIVILSVVVLALAFYVTAPVIGEIGIVIGTTVFSAFRFVRLFW